MHHIGSKISLDVLVCVTDKIAENIIRINQEHVNTNVQTLQRILLGIKRLDHQTSRVMSASRLQLCNWGYLLLRTETSLKCIRWRWSMLVRVYMATRWKEYRNMASSAHNAFNKFTEHTYMTLSGTVVPKCLMTFKQRQGIWWAKHQK